jgi:hypothetical protein
VISETRFARSYSSLWRELTPTLELFVRKANLRLVEREWTPLNSIAAPGRRALLNQVAFETLKGSFASEEALAERLDWIEEKANIVTAELALTGANTCSDTDISEIRTLSRRMCSNLMRHQPHRVDLEPTFSGCGVINECSGDALSSDLRFIELKDGDRPFRSYDFRQLVIYAALNMNQGNGVAKEFQIINSRRGISVTVPFVQFASESAGQSPVDLLAEVIRVISDVTVYQN